MRKLALLAALVLAAGAAASLADPAAAQEGRSRVTIEGGVRVITGSVADDPAPVEADALPGLAVGDLDAGGSGGVSFDQLLGAQADDPPAEALAGVEAWFQGVDLDQDGVLTEQALGGLVPGATAPAKEANVGSEGGANEGGP